MPRNSTGPPQLAWVSVCWILKDRCFQGLMLKSPQLLEDKRSQAWHRKLGLEQYRWLFTKELRDVRTNCQSLGGWRWTKKIPGDFMLFQGDNLTVVMEVFSCLWCIRIVYSSIEIGQNCWDGSLVFIQMLPVGGRWGWYVDLSSPFLLLTSPVDTQFSASRLSPHTEFLVLSRKFGD